MELVGLGFGDEFLNPKAFVHRVLAIAQEASNSVRFGREGN
jgi:hypothetical protein